MPTNRPPQGLEEADYETIEAAVMETARGRWFLAEHARRTREAETARMLDAIGQIEKLVREQSQPRPDTIDRQDATRLLGLIEERLLDLSWMMKSRGLDPSLCEVVDREALRIGHALDSDAGLELAEPLPTLPAPVELQPQVVEPTPESDTPPGQEAAEPPIQAVAVIPPTETPPEPRPLRLEALAFLDRMTPRERQRFFA
jgi:hypothetical protein